MHDHSLQRRRELDQWCDRFESEWKSNSEPNLSRFVAEWQGDDREQLFRQLLELEFEYRAKRGEAVSTERYSREFPEFATIVEEMSRSFQTQAAGIKTPSAERTGGERAAGRPGPPKVLGNYEILESLGQGGMGQVFKARHRRMDRLVAVKLLPPELNQDEAMIQRFHREVKAAARLSHPNIVIAHDADEAPGGVHFLVMEYVEGRDLAKVIQSEPRLPIIRALNYVLQAARGLEYAHQNGVVHRDIKPANLLLDAKGTVKILDLGLARFGDAAARAKDGLTKSGDVMGTVDYMAPEQAFDTHSVDGRADIYSLGCTLYRLLTNKNLYEADTIVQKLMAHQSKPIPELQAARNDIPAALDVVFKRMVAKNANDRYPSMAAVIADLQAIYDSLANSSAIEPSKSDGKLNSFFHGLTSQSGGDAPTAALATAAHPQVATTDRALEATINLSSPSQATDPVSDHSIKVARTLAPQALVRNKPAGPGGRNRNLLIAAGFGGLLLALLAIWVIVKDKNGKEIARFQVPDGGSAEVKEVAESPKGNLVPNQQVSPPPAKAPFDAAQAKAHQEAWAKHLGTEVVKPNSIGMKMTLIPPGEFLMGAPDSDTDAAPHEKPQHRVILTKPFAMSATEITIRQFRQFVEATKYVTQAESDGQGAFDLQRVRQPSSIWSKMGQDETPVRCVSWEDARRFCEWLTQTEGCVYRLPTEAEWEFACRAGTVTRYSFGNALSDTTSPPGTDSAPLPTVAQLPANPFGLFDMHGNINEICWDAGRTFTPEPVTDPVGSLLMSVPGVVRGGAVSSRAARLRSSNRYLTDARQFPERDFATPMKGFRVVAEIGSPAPAKAPFDAKQAKAHQEAWAKHLGVPPEWKNSIGMKFVLIPPGEFRMGSSPEEIAKAIQENPNASEQIKSEAPQHKVVLTQPYYLGVTEVTQAQYELIMKGKPAKFCAAGPGKDFVQGIDTSNLPVENVTWNNAVEFCIQLSNKEKLQPCYVQDAETFLSQSGDGYGLPTEAQWEFACRAGTLGRFFAGDQAEDLTRVSWVTASSDGQTQAVGRRPPNSFGLHDTHGNVYEWVHDWWAPNYYGEFQAQAAGNPRGPTAGTRRGLRGGGWRSDPCDCRASFRDAHDPTSIHDDIGFRVSLSVDAVKAAVANQKPTVENTPPINAAFNTALRFDGNDTVEVPSLGLNTQADFTWELYVAEPQQSPSGKLGVVLGVTEKNRFFEDESSGKEEGQFLCLTKGTPGHWRWKYGEGSDLSGTAITRVPARAERTHLACVHEGKSFRLFVEGKLFKSVECETPRPGTGSFEIGPRFVGVVDEVRISQVARYREDFQPEPRFTTDAETLALFHCDENQGDVLNDSSGRGRHGKITGAQWVSAEGSSAPSQPTK